MPEINVTDEAIYEVLNYKSDLDLNNILSNIDYVIESKFPSLADPTWFRLYKSGWLEQGGEVANSKSDTKTISLLKSYKDTSYSLIRTQKVVNSTTTVTMHCLGYISKTTSSFTIYSPSTGNESSTVWQACGLIA